MSEVRLSLAIMHLTTDSWRRSMVADQIRRMGGVETLNRETEYWEVTKDTLGAGPWPTARRAWLASLRAPRATHHVIVQDDALLCRDFLPGLKAALSEVPEAVVSLFTIHDKVAEAQKAGFSWIQQRDDVWGLGIAMPSAWAPEFVRWCDTHIPPGYLHDERRVAIWMLANDRACFSPVPSLMEHAGATRSTLGHNDARCVASWFIGADSSALDVDWSLGLDSPIYATTEYTLSRRMADVARSTARDSTRTQARTAAVLERHERRVR